MAQDKSVILETTCFDIVCYDHHFHSWKIKHTRHKKATDFMTKQVWTPRKTKSDTFLSHSSMHHYRANYIFYSCNMGTWYVCPQPEGWAYISGKSRVPMLQVLCNTSSEADSLNTNTKGDIWILYIRMLE